MGLSLILPMANRAVLRARFFQSHGVTLESHARSRSGVREEDGMVVFAMPVERVRSTHGVAASCCGLAAIACAMTRSAWRRCTIADSPFSTASPRAFCSAGTTRQWSVRELLALRVVKVGREYWAKWGHAVRAELARARVCNDGARSRRTSATPSSAATPRNGRLRASSSSASRRSSSCATTPSG